MTRMKKIRLYAAALAMFVGALGVLVPVMGGIVLNGTPSVPAHVLWKTPGEPVAKGDYVMVPARHDYIPPQYPFLTKRALCMPGERLQYQAPVFLCDGVPINRTKAETLTGAPLTPFEWRDGVVPPGHVFIGSDHPDGFDSRYLGFFRLDDVVRLEAIL